jgi:putative ABC transport system permease protein
LSFTILATFLTGLGFGLAPAWQLSHSNPNDALKQTPRIVQTRWGRWHLRDLLVGLQVALALMLLVGASLLIRSVQSLLSVDPGIRPAQVLTVQVEPPPLSEFQRDPLSLTQFYQRMIDAVRPLPGVEGAAVGTSLPFGWANSSTVFYLEGQPLPENGKFPSVSNHSVSPDYFRTMGISLIRGHVFDGHEPEPSFPPAIPFTPENLPTLYKNVSFQGVISKSMAEKYWPGDNPIGKRFRIGFPNMGLPWVEIIGIVSDVTQTGLDQGPTPEFYLSLRQFGIPNSTHLVLRTITEPLGVATAVRAALHREFPDNPVTNIRPMQELLDERISDRKFNLRLFVFFAGTALLLAVIGLYGVLAFVVGQRTREIGIRMALGASRGDVLCDIIRRGLWLVLPGLALGGIAAWAASRFLQSQLYAITRSDPTSYFVAASLLLIAAVIACLLPARRATKVNPIEALRAE